MIQLYSAVRNKRAINSHSGSRTEAEKRQVCCATPAQRQTLEVTHTHARTQNTLNRFPSFLSPLTCFSFELWGSFSRTEPWLVAGTVGRSWNNNNKKRKKKKKKDATVPTWLDTAGHSLRGEKVVCGGVPPATLSWKEEWFRKKKKKSFLRVVAWWNSAPLCTCWGGKQARTVWKWNLGSENWRRAAPQQIKKLCVSAWVEFNWTELWQQINSKAAVKMNALFRPPSPPNMYIRAVGITTLLFLFVLFLFIKCLILGATAVTHPDWSNRIGVCLQPKWTVKVFINKFDFRWRHWTSVNKTVQAS